MGRMMVGRKKSWFYLVSELFAEENIFLLGLENLRATFLDVFACKLKEPTSFY